jgi:beta-galactosidase/beta-glucuronidase
VQPGIPRSEYPRPALRRPRWLCLNGPWELELDPLDVGLGEGWHTGRAFSRRIVVPYPLEAELSGLADRTEHAVCWYRRTLALPPEYAGQRLVLHIGACDHAARVFVNGREAGTHRGGYAPIALEIGPLVRSGENELVVRVEDRETWTQPRGKQIAGAVGTGIDYDRVTGIWQSVWLEPLPALSIASVYTRFSLARRELAVHVEFGAARDAALFDGEVEVVLFDGERLVARGRAPGLGRPELRLALGVGEAREWSPAAPRLHRLEARLLHDGVVLDTVESDVGLRELTWSEGELRLNGERLFLRGLLDQGYFPGGWYTAASDDDLRRDVELALAMGFNMVRKHQKAEDPRFLYWADRLGLLVWAELPSGRDFTTRLVTTLTEEWMALVRRDRMHASVVGWVPLNESWGVWQQATRPEQRALVEALTSLTRALDPTRPVLGNDGWEWSTGDLRGIHSYASTGDTLVRHLHAILSDPDAEVLLASEPLGPKRGVLPGADPAGRAVVLTECGGIGYLGPDASPLERELFVYGRLPRSAAELEARLRDLVAGIEAAPGLAGFVWTQFTDVQQERNGLLDFERRPKLPLALLREIFGAIGTRD